MAPAELERQFSRALKKVDPHWGEAILTMAYNPIHIRPIPQGSFSSFAIRNGGSSLPHINPPEAMVKELAHLSEVGA